MHTRLVVEEDKTLYRDSSSGAIINTNKKALEDYRKARTSKLSMQTKIDNLEQEVQDLKNIINNIIDKLKD